MSTSPSVAGRIIIDPVIDATAVRAALGRCRAVVERHAAYLTRLDAVLGDGDHGDNLVIGFRSVEAMLEGLPPDTPPGELIRAVGHRLVSAVGGASGPLYGTAFLEAGALAGDDPTIDPASLSRMLSAAADGLARRGRCTVGDKTILDALQPAAEAMADGLAQGLSAGAASAAAVRAAARGMRSTRPLLARRGLALRLGDRSVGHLDPGAASCTFLLRAIADG
ncbi:MAG TPA: dihydroxyacetone kinase subunit DhaL [Candidatus Limnocylindrales bacterium]|nr:dihydroxyacetone kinase subunit DhaL [Candidatus Limnocylindrales bacterium]